MNLRLSFDTMEYGPAYVACIQAAGEVQARFAYAAEQERQRREWRSRRSVTSMALPDDSRAGYIPCADDFGLSARESGMWGRLRANGLSPEAAAAVVRAARLRPEGGAA